MNSKKNVIRVFFLIFTIALFGYAYWKRVIPVHRVEIKSELIMLGDFDDNRRWTAADVEIVNDHIQYPFQLSDENSRRFDMNQNGLIDNEDLFILKELVSAGGDPYAAEERNRSKGQSFPRPRELYRYVSMSEYRPRPFWTLEYPGVNDSILSWLKEFEVQKSIESYKSLLNVAIYNEAIRFDQAWRRRNKGLSEIEKDYAERKLRRAENFYRAGENYELLLALMELVEDAETLTVKNQPEFPLKLLAFRDHLREILASPLYSDFKTGKQSWQAVLKRVSDYTKSDLNLEYNFELLDKPRDLTNLENYLQRTEWQYYKSSTTDEAFRLLINYAQHDPRYLRAVSRTSRKLTDQNVENHNLPMVLLFREALRIEGGDKKSAVGLLDEAIRIPFAWVKSLPKENLPSSLAQDNFLLPGNKEDGADKSRHWNVFGGICLYKSPQEALDLALKREMQDFRDDNFSVGAMTEFFRDTIANLNGMYHVMSVNPELLSKEKQ